MIYKKPRSVPGLFILGINETNKVKNKEPIVFLHAILM